MNDQLYIAILGALTIALYYRFIKKNSADVYFSVFIFSCFMTYFFIFNGLRQALAIAIALQAIKPLLDRKYFRYVLIILFAMTFHYVAGVVFLLFIFKFVSAKPGISAFFCLVAIGILTGIILRPALTVFLGSGNYADKLASDAFGGAGSILNPVLYLLIFFIANLFINFKMDGRDYIFYNMFALATVFYLFSLQIQIFNRVTYFFTPSTMIIIPRICKGQRSNENRIALTSLFYLLILVYGLALIVRGANGILPYEFFWR